MKKVLCLSFLAVTLVACSAPQGKKYSATNRELPPIAMPPPVAAAEIYGSQQGNIVALTPVPCTSWSVNATPPSRLNPPRML